MKYGSFGSKARREALNSKNGVVLDGACALVPPRYMTFPTIIFVNGFIGFLPKPVMPIPPIPEPVLYGIPPRKNVRHWCPWMMKPPPPADVSNVPFPLKSCHTVLLLVG